MKETPPKGALCRLVLGFGKAKPSGWFGTGEVVEAEFWTANGSETVVLVVHHLLLQWNAEEVEVNG